MFYVELVSGKDVYIRDSKDYALDKVSYLDINEYLKLDLSIVGCFKLYGSLVAFPARYNDFDEKSSKFSKKVQYNKGNKGILEVRLGDGSSMSYSVNCFLNPKELLNSSSRNVIATLQWKIGNKFIFNITEEDTTDNFCYSYYTVFSEKGVFLESIVTNSKLALSSTRTVQKPNMKCATVEVYSSKNKLYVETPFKVRSRCEVLSCIITNTDNELYYVTSLSATKGSDKFTKYILYKLDNPYSTTQINSVAYNNVKQSGKSMNDVVNDLLYRNPNIKFARFYIASESVSIDRFLNEYMC